LTKTTKIEKELTKANLKLAAELVELRLQLSGAGHGYIEAQLKFSAALTETCNLRRHISALTDASEAQEREINQLRSNLGTFRDRFKSRVSDMHNEARYWGISIEDLLAV
jgi:predicted  nucleic acid-binding Zn-ribbon protein